jgi:alcohol dehydrogenase
VSFAGYAGRRLDIVARDRARFGAGVVAELPSIVESLGGRAAFVVTDAGVVGSGVAGRVVDLLVGAGLRVELFDGVQPNPGTASIERGSAALRAVFSSDRAGGNVVVIGLGGG